MRRVGGKETQSNARTDGRSGALRTRRRVLRPSAAVESTVESTPQTRPRRTTSPLSAPSGNRGQTATGETIAGYPSAATAGVRMSCRRRTIRNDTVRVWPLAQTGPVRRRIVRSWPRIPDETQGSSTFKWSRTTARCTRVRPGQTTSATRRVVSGCGMRPPHRGGMRASLRRELGCAGSGPDRARQPTPASSPPHARTTTTTPTTVASSTDRATPMRRRVPGAVARRTDGHPAEAMARKLRSATEFAERCSAERVAALNEA